MMFHTTAFILGFLPICLVGFFMLGRFYGARWAVCWLVAFSLFFYGWWNPEHLPLLVGSVGLNYAVARKLQHSDRPRAWLTAGVALNLTLLGWFKYADFLMHIVAPNAPALHITLPLAISFFTFQQIMFLVDTSRRAGPGAGSHLGGLAGTASPPSEARLVGLQTGSLPGDDANEGAKPGQDLGGKVGLRGTIPPTHLPPFLTYATFVTFFPHLIAGPIVRPSRSFRNSLLGRVARPRLETITDGLLIFLLGLGKKLVLADMFGGFADTGFDAAGAWCLTDLL